MGSGCADPRFLDLGTRWRWVISFTPLPRYPRGKSPRYTLDRGMGGPQSRYGCCGEKSCIAGNRTRAVQLEACYISNVFNEQVSHLTVQPMMK
jgi:hypothetical protein